MGFLAVAIPTAISYIFKLDSSFMAGPETYRHVFVKDYKLFHQTYTPFYTNLGGYLCGVLCGEIYQKYLCHEDRRQKLKQTIKYLWLVVPLAGWIIDYVGTIMIFHEPSLWTALYTGLNRNLWILLVCFIPVLILACDSEYSRSDLPPLYNFDDYDECFQNATPRKPATYCMIYAEIQITQFFERVHKYPLDLEIRSNYSHVIQQCLNTEFERKYNLNLRTFIEYCERRPEDKSHKENDLAERALYKSFKVILLLVALSTFFDYFLKMQQSVESQTNEFYQTNLEKPVWRLLTSFSLTRNYYRLIQPYRGEIGQQFAYLDGMRSACTLFVLRGHSIFLEFEHVQNPKYFEDFGKNTAGLMALNGPVVIEIFLVMSGLLLHLKFSQARFVTPHSSWKRCLSVYIFILISRYMRFLPTLIALIGINATIMTSFGDGPFWRHIIEPSRTFGRENWWKNLLLINNFSPPDTASPHTWYLAADFQLFSLYTLISTI
uniref:Acyltransferase 3 domain-containing protein n=1 Tax=Musca domestica TaxID=7370 RepID=A0A1I8NJC7_MUSDO